MFNQMTGGIPLCWEFTCFVSKKSILRSNVVPKIREFPILMFDGPPPSVTVFFSIKSIVLTFLTRLWLYLSLNVSHALFLKLIRRMNNQ